MLDIVLRDLGIDLMAKSPKFKHVCASPVQPRCLGEGPASPKRLWDPEALVSPRWELRAE